MEEEEEDVEHGDFFADRVDLGFFEGDPVEDEVFFFEPLLEEKPVSWGFGYLVKRVKLFPFHD